MTHDVRRYTFTPEDRLFLDTNIWWFIYVPQKPKATRQVEVYSQVLRDIHEARSRIHIDVLVVSEFINAYARREWRSRRPDIRDFKYFRQSEEFESVAAEIAHDVKLVTSQCEQLASGFDTLRIDEMMSAYGAGHSDFNDQVIAQLCRKEGLTLITHDLDFKHSDISILTANHHLLAIDETAA